MKTLAKIAFTAVVIVMVFLPVPPTTLIGMALIAHPRTNQFLDPRALAAMFAVLAVLKVVAMWKVKTARRILQRA